MNECPDTPAGWSRRTFLQAVGLGLLARPTFATLGRDTFGADLLEAWSGPPLGPSDGILVVVTLYGGNDGLNTVVRYGDGLYYSMRPGLAVPPADVLAIDDQIGLHPQLRYLKTLHDAGHVAIVDGVGCPNPTYSHFRSMETWMAGTFAAGDRGTGWMGRWLDRLPEARADLAAVSVDLAVPLHMTGAVRQAVAVSAGGDGFGTDSSADKRRLFDCLRQMAVSTSGRGPLHDAFATTLRNQIDLAGELAPVFSPDFPEGELARKLTVAARLINADVGLRVIDVGRSGFDTHEHQWQSQPDLFRDLDRALQSFFATLSPALQNRVTLMTVSEFGRTPWANGSGGTDHGSAAPMFVIGAAVKGGHYGEPPSLATLDANRQMTATVDFRSVYGSVIDGWMGGGGSEIVGGSFETLGLFRSAPGASLTGKPVPIEVVPPPSASGFCPISPVRILDTRDGTGGRDGPLRPGETWTLLVRGVAGVPSDAVAVAVNLTSVDATRPSFVTVWPSGQPRPVASNLNPVPGGARPNMIIGRLGTDGSLSLYNNSGDVHLVGDLCGYFSPTYPGGLLALPPTRLLDTRLGLGAAKGPVGPDGRIDLQVVGRAGVPVGSTSVVLNMCADQPTAPSFLTVWPAGVPRPTASSLNMTRGETVSNLVISALGADGRVSVYNQSGATHVIADVLGAFGSDFRGRFAPLAPGRVLDTRAGIGVAGGPVGQSPVRLCLLGQHGVPAAQVSAVVLNVTAVSPTLDTFVVVYPSGRVRPVAANVNATAGRVTPNLVLAQLGTDGCVELFNNSGRVDLVADVLGYFSL